jgi:hypothetical protein
MAQVIHIALYNSIKSKFHIKNRYIGNFLYMRGGGVPGPTTVCVYVWRVKEIERAVK